MFTLKLGRAMLPVLGIALMTLVATGLTNWTSIASEPDCQPGDNSLESEDYIEALLFHRKTPIVADMPEEAMSIVTGYDQAANRIRCEASNAIREERLTVLRRLKALQDKYTRSAALDEAVAIRNTIRQLLEAGTPTIDNPGTMHAYTNQVGKSFLVRVTGKINGSIYGTEFFTYDSDLATACVHSGILRENETGLVIVKLVSTNKPHQGSTKNGVRSYDYSIYPTSYTVRRWKPSEEEIELGSLKLE